ncbi:hypothetical protein N7468_000723 [Penicillium chermesinum]|uniref:Zn(2)-C6 fungal-type domain-containing protein n=1 Tax=Penicillium chermesinum TaxID=63820 RepID=A0A9W9PKV8_9EURO|nr:uncharacterized protein N7468_000723 [Penicillium chermesinum]KAJ5249272.1 hypothetical protein N7468_000723 [Penicillium chermesinum]KAJ6151361.1 hypothetical protein N7470_007955 [Penicillium chermesinum]
MDPTMCNATASRPRSEQPHDGKPGRLRAACTNCHAAKLRCSGERSGCTRCRTLNQDCVYLESRVGKTRGRRKQQLSPAAVDLNNRPTTATSSHEEAPRQMGESSAVPGLSPASSSGDADFLNNDIWDVSQSISDSVMLDGITDPSGVEFFQQFSQKEVIENPLGGSWGNIQEERTDSAPQLLDSAIEIPDEDTTPTMRPSPWTAASDETSKTSRHSLKNFPPRFTQQRGLATRMGPCPEALEHDHKGVVVVAAEILESLEGKICAGLSAIDEVLRINKEATQKINHLLKRSDYTRSMGSLMVVVAAAHYVVCLFETACDNLFSSPCPGRWSLPPTTDSSHSHNRFRGHRGSVGSGMSTPISLNPPGIGFGTFLLDPQDQAAMVARIIYTELHRTLRMVQSLSAPMQAGCFAPDLAPVAVDGWLQDLKQRLRTLISSMESSERNWDG